MPTIAYNASRMALFQPEARETLFVQGFDIREEVQLSLEAARLAYYGFDEDHAEAIRLEHALALAGFNTPTLFQHAGSDGQGFGAVNTKGQGLLAFRGTQPDRVGDLVTDAHILLKRWDLGQGNVHAGFSNTALGLWPDVKGWLDNVKPASLIICGHSLGAAIATLLALPSNARRLVTIGSPRVGDSEFTMHLNASSLKRLRIVDCCDVVTQIPPESLGFRHIGGEFVYVDRTGVQHSSPEESFVDADRSSARLEYLADYAFRFGTVLARDLADHAPINYIRAFWP